MAAQDPHEMAPGAPGAGPVSHPGEEPHPEFDASAGPVGREGTGIIVVHIAGEGGEAGGEGGLVALALGEGGQSVSRENGIPVDDGGAEGAVFDRHLLVGVADGEDDLPVGGELGGGEIEGGDGGGGHGEFGEAGAEDEPDDEGDGANDDEDGDRSDD